MKILWRNPCFPKANGEVIPTNLLLSRRKFKFNESFAVETESAHFNAIAGFDVEVLPVVYSYELIFLVVPPFLINFQGKLISISSAVDVLHYSLCIKISKVLWSKFVI